MSIRIRSLILILASVCAACAPHQLRDEPYLILVSIDGFGWDFREATATPTLDRIAATGVRAEAMRPVFPTMTFPNHYSIATGLYPFEHGIVDNSFPNAARTAWYAIWDREAVQDGSWYGGEPIWVSAENNGIRSAAFFFVGTEAAIGGVSPSHWYPFDASIPGERRVAQVLDWLTLPAAERPHMITLYFEHVDTATHEFGPGSAESLEAIRLVDGFLGLLLDGIAALELRDSVYLVIVSDHGQASIRPADEAFVLEDHVSLDGLDVRDHASYVSLYLQPGDERRATELRDAVNAAWAHGGAYLRDESPAHWRTSGDPRFADVTVLADPGYGVISRRDEAWRIKRGSHGWDPSYDAMRGIFLASGPRLPRGERVGEVGVVDVYPLLMDILGLPPPDHVDGRGDVLRALLQRPGR